MTVELLQVALGLLLLVAGAEGLVKGAVSLAGRAGVSPLLLGLTVVAFGTSTPEVAVSIDAARSGQGAMALGNVVGSNVFNILVILGGSALVAPLVVRARLVRVDVPLMLAASVLPFLLALNHHLGPGEGALLLAVLAGYLLLLARLARSERRQASAGDFQMMGWAASLLYVAGGLVFLVVGADRVVVGAVA
ncbi:MAG: hypothetical protein RQ751_12405, partial [Longimicrobiales bacterium]|nr:hypothetical protein [Longimicrobiales bacterium]